MKELKIVEIWKKIGEGSYYLFQSIDVTDNSRNQMMCEHVINAQGAILIDLQDGNFVKFAKYATFNSPIHCLTASPAETLFKNASSWEEIGESNGFDLKAVSTLLPAVEPEYKVVTEFDIPDEYTGPKYKKRILTFSLGFPIPIKVEMFYANGEKDVGVIELYKNGDIKISWQCQYGPNKMNVNFF